MKEREKMYNALTWKFLIFFYYNLMTHWNSVSHIINSLSEMMTRTKVKTG